MAFTPFFAAAIAGRSALAMRLAAAGAVAAKGVGIGGAVVAGTTVGSLFTSASREANYASNRIGPTWVPEISDLIHLFYAGRMGSAQIAEGMNNQGITWSADWADHELWPTMWNQIVELHRPMHDLLSYRKWLRQGRLTPGRWRGVLQRAGFNPSSGADSERQSNQENYDLLDGDWDALDLDLLVELWRRGKILEPEMRMLLATLNIRGEDAERLLFQMDQPPPEMTALELTNRGLISPAELDEYLHQAGYRRPEERNRIAELRFRIPPAPDLVRYALREAWDQATVARFRYDEEFPPEFAFWMQKQGADWDARTDAQKAANQPPVTWTQLDWRAHWSEIAPGWAADFFHRFRPNRIARYQGQFPQLTPFLIDDYRRVLKINDYAPAFREQIAAANSTLLTRVDIKRSYELRVIDAAEVKEQFLDRGYTEPDAAILQEQTVRADRVRRANRFTRLTKASVIETYALGLLDRATTARQLYELQFEDPAKVLEFRALPAAGQTALAAADPFVAAELDNADFERLVAKGKAAIAIIHKLYLQAAIRDDETANRLTEAGVTDDRIAEYLEWWSFERRGPRKLLTTRQIQAQYIAGVISYAYAYQRLVLLGYHVEDAVRILSLASKTVALNLAKADATAARTVAGQQRALLAQLKALEQERRSAQTELARYAGPALLVKWYAREYIDRSTLERRIRGIVAEEAKVTWWLEQADDALAERQAKQAGAA